MGIDRIGAGAPERWRRMVALGDSLTEGLSDSSRQAPGEYRGWADRLAASVATTGRRAAPLQYANLAVRSRRVEHVVDEQVPLAIELGADLATVLVGANDLVRRDCRFDPLADRLAGGIAALRASGADVLLVAPFGPERWYLDRLDRRFARFAEAVGAIAAETGSILLDVGADPFRADPRSWAQDRVHLSSHGHRVLSYRAAEAIGLPGAAAVGALDIALHDEPGRYDSPTGTAHWLAVHVAPWAVRRLRGRTAGDGRAPKHESLVPLHARSQQRPVPSADLRER
jgi:phosphatidylinositol alpha 1,6-mannosyltransferase